VIQLKGLPAKFVGIVYAPHEKAALRAAIKQLQIPRRCKIDCWSGGGHDREALPMVRQHRLGLQGAPGSVGASGGESMTDELKLSTTICRAINGRHLLGITLLDETHRIVEPHAFGQGEDGHPLLWAWCVSAMGSDPTAEGAWLQCATTDMRDVRIFAETFHGPRPGYSRGDKQMWQIHCQL
jgi:hypothetical protein